MAKQRINPEGAPERIMQPVASPVDMFYRTEPDGFLKIAQGLSSLAPGLANLSNSIIETIAKREAVEGSIEGERLAALPDSKNGLATVKQPKLAKAIEDSGGISPWRAQSLLESFGRNTVLQQYTRRIEQEFEDLSNPLGPDGQLRPADYAQRRMAEIFTATSAAIPQNSYYARKAAEATRAEVDPVVLYKIGQAYVKKTKEEHVRAYVNQAVDVLEAGDYAAFQKAIPALADKYRQETGQSGDDLITAALVTHAKMKARSGVAGATVLLQEALDEGINGRPLGATVRAQLEDAIDAVSRIEETNLKNETHRRTIAANDSFDLVVQKLESMPEEALPDGKEEIAALVDSTLSESKLPIEMAARIRGTLLKETREHVAAIRRGGTEMQALSSDPVVLEGLRDRIDSMTEQEAIQAVDAMWKNGAIPRAAYSQLRQEIRARREVPGGLDNHATAEIENRVKGALWAGTTEQQIPPDKLPAFRDIEAQIRAKARTALLEISGDPKLVSEQNPVVRLSKMQEEFSKRLGQIITETRESNKDLIAYANHSEFYSTKMREIVTREAGTAAAETITALMDVKETNDAGRPDPGYSFLVTSILEQVSAEGRKWFQSRIDAGRSLMQIQEEWDVSGRAAVRDSVIKNYQDVEWADKNLPEYVRNAVPGEFYKTKRTARTGYDQAIIPALAQQSLATVRSNTVQEPYSWKQRVFDSEIDFTEAVGEAQDAARDYALNRTDESRARYEASLRYMGSVSDNVIKTMKESPQFKFMDGGVAYYSVYAGRPEAGNASIDWRVNEKLTLTYWAMKSVRGLSQQERDAGKTLEGVAIPDQMWKPEMKLFVDRVDFETAVRSGEVTRIYQKAVRGGYAGTMDSWVATQMGVIQALTPESTPTSAGNNKQ